MKKMKQISKYEFEQEVIPKKTGPFFFEITCIVLLIFALSAYIHSQKNYDKIEKSTELVYNYPDTSTPIETVTRKIRPEHSDYEIIMWYLKSKESLSLTAYLDGTENGKPRYSIGWGTRSTKGATISRWEADKLCKEAYEKRYLHIKNKYPSLDRWDHLVLATVRYNVGTFGENLHKAASQADREGIYKILPKYNKNSEGKVLASLTARRYADIELMKATEEDKQKYAKMFKKTVDYKIGELPTHSRADGLGFGFQRMCITNNV